jgi:hypothetical protein
MCKMLWRSSQMEQGPPEGALTGIIVHGGLTDIDAGLLLGDSPMHPDWWVRAAAARQEALT